MPSALERRTDEMAQTGECVPDHYENVLHGVYASEFLQEVKVEEGVGLAIGDEDGLDFCALLVIHALQKSKFICSDEVCTLISLRGKRLSEKLEIMDGIGAACLPRNGFEASLGG